MTEPAMTLKEIATDFAKVNAAAKAYFHEHIEPEIRQCSTISQYRSVVARVYHEAATEDGIRELPAEISVGMLLLYSTLGLRDDTKTV